jgi:hypothetical protein
MINNNALTPWQPPRGNWRRSSYSGTSGNCIEVAAISHGGRAVRDSKDPTGPVLTFTTDQWSAFHRLCWYWPAALDRLDHS